MVYSMSGPRRARRTTGLIALLSALALTVSAGASVQAQDGDADRLVVWNYFQTPGQIQALEEMATLFNEQYPDVEVVYETQPFEQMTSNLLAAAAAGNGPDAIIYQWGDVLKLVESGALSSLEPHFAGWQDADLIPASVVHRVTDFDYDPDGEAYTIQPYVNLIGLYYNKAILEDVGIEPPTTMEELEAALAAVTEAGYTGMTVDWRPGVGGWWGGMPWIWANGGDITMSEDQRQAIEDAFTLVRSWVENGYVPADVVTFDQQAAMLQWLTGDVAFTVNGNWELTRVIDEAGFDWDVVPIPAGPAGSAVYLGGEGVAIGAFTENADLAWDYLASTWLSQPGQLSLVDSVGSIPARTDLADAPEIQEGVGLSGFLAEVPTGQRLPITQAENEAQTLFGDTFSAVVSGQTSPADAAELVISQTEGILAGDE